MPSLSLIVLAVLAQAATRYPGDMPGGQSGSSVSAPLPLTFECRGDSIMRGACSAAGPCDRVRNAIVGSTRSNQAKDGYTTAQIRECYFNGDGNGCAPYTSTGGRRLLLGGPVNSLKTGDSVTGEVEQAAIDDLLAVVDNALARGVQVTWLDGLPYATCHPATCPSLTDAHLRMTTFNSLKATACAARAGNPLLKCVSGLYAEFSAPSPVGALADTYACADDHLHLNDTGSALLACRMLQAIGFPCP